MTLVSFALFDVVGALRELIYNLSAFVYQIIIYLYKIFEKLCSARILDSEILDSMASRVGVILGIIMLFMTMFSVVQLVLEPEKLTDKEKGVGNIVKKILIVIVMLGMSSSVFSLMYGVQKTIIKSGIINKFLLPYELTEDAEENFGGLLASNLFTAFFDLHERYKVDGIDGNEEGIQTCVNSLRGEIIAYGTFSQGLTCINNKDSNDNYYVDFNWILLPIVGAFAVYFIFSYCLSVGMRTFQLTVLEVISPMAIVSYLSPKKDTMFQKWWKIYFSTYVDVFIRIAIINVSVFLIGVIFDANMSGTFWESVGGKTTEWYTNTLLTVFIIISLLMFAKKAPDLLKELFPGAPSKLGFGITPPKKLLDNMAGADLIKRGYGAARVGTGRIIGNARNAFGKVFDANAEIKEKEKALKTLMATPGASAEDIAKTRNKINEKKAERNRWLLRGSFGALGSGFGGLAAGAMTNDKNGRKNAISSGVKHKKDVYKTRDAGYHIGDQVEDYLRYGLFNRDTNLEDMAAAKDMEAQTLNQKVAELQRTYNGGHTITAAKRGGYIIDGDFQHPKTEAELNDIISRDDSYKVAKEIADLSAQAGKATSAASALRKAKEEQKAKKDK